MQYIISTDRIRSEESIHVQETISPKFLDVAENELEFTENVILDVKLSLTDDFLLINGSIETSFHCPCKICNELFKVPLSIHFQWSTDDAVSQEFDLLPVIREQILLEIPLFAECNGGSCPERSTIENYFVKPEEKANPFASLNSDF